MVKGRQNYAYHAYFASGSRHALEDTEVVVRVGQTGLLEVTVSSLAERKRVEPEGTLACEVSSRSYSDNFRLFDLLGISETINIYSNMFLRPTNRVC